MRSLNCSAVSPSRAALLLGHPSQFSSLRIVEHMYCSRPPGRPCSRTARRIGRAELLEVRNAVGEQRSRFAGRAS
jgi:hypothetical protein